MKWKRHALRIALITVWSIAGCLAVLPDVAVCVEQPEIKKRADIESITTTGDGPAAELHILLTAPATYTSYKTISPLRLVIDLSQVTLGSITAPIVVNTGNFKTVTASRFDTDAGVLTRVEIELANDSEALITVLPTNPAELKISFPALAESAPSPEKNDLAETPAPVMELPHPPEPPPAAPPVSEPVPVASVPAPAPAPAGEVSSRTLTAISVNNNTVTLALDGMINDFKTFRLNKPERYVVDLIDVKNGLPTRMLPLNASGIASARIGSYPDKTRIVLDSINGTFPEATAVKTDRAVVISLDVKQVDENSHTKLITTKVAKSDGEMSVPPANAAIPVVPQPELRPVIKPAPPQETQLEIKPVDENEHTKLIATRVEKPVREKSLPPVKAADHIALQPEAVKLPPGTSAIEMIDFQVLDGISRVSVKVNGVINAERPSKTTGYVSLTIKNSILPKKLQRSLETGSFVSPVLRITPLSVKTRKGTDTTIRIATRADTPYEFRQEGDMLYIDFKYPEGISADKLVEVTEQKTRVVSPKAAPVSDEELTTDLSRGFESSGRPLDTSRNYKGRKVTLEFADAEVRKIFQLLSEVSNKNFVLADEVSGAISLKLVNVPWDQALDIILDTKGLEKREDGNIILIKGKGKFKSQAEEELEIKKTQLKGEVLYTEYFPINYSKTGAMKSQVEGLLSANTGKVSEDERTNTLIITAIRSDMDKIKTYLGKMDVPERQVMIEARIVEASSSFTMNLGVSWGTHYRDGTASFLGINQMDNSFGGLTSPAVTTGQSGNAGTNMGISFGRLASNIQLDMRLNAAATAGLIKVVSTPKIATLNNKTAKIIQGQSIPYQNTTATTGATTQFVQAVLSLEVKPHINANGTIGMEIKATNNSAGTGSPPPIDTKEATTEMLLKDGETTVIGGIYKEDETLSEEGVPFLMDIPFLGRLFKSSASVKTKSELLIFITPRILN